jgi:hypothetical protein
MENGGTVFREGTVVGSHSEMNAMPNPYEDCQRVSWKSFKVLHRVGFWWEGGWGSWEHFRFGGALKVFSGVNSYPCMFLLGAAQVDIFSRMKRNEAARPSTSHPCPLRLLDGPIYSDERHRLSSG